MGTFFSWIWPPTLPNTNQTNAIPTSYAPVSGGSYPVSNDRHNPLLGDNTSNTMTNSVRTGAIVRNGGFGDINVNNDIKINVHVKSKPPKFPTKMMKNILLDKKTCSINCFLDFQLSNITLIIYIPSLQADLVSPYLFTLRKTVYDLIRFINFQTQNHAISPATNHQGLALLEVKNVTKFKIFREKFTRYMNEKMDENMDDNANNEQDFNLSLECLFNIDEWSNLNIIKMAFALGLDKDCIYILDALDVCVDNIQSIKSDDIESIANTYQLERGKCWEFVQSLAKAVTCEQQ